MNAGAGFSPDHPAVARLLADRERQGLPAIPTSATATTVATVLRPRSTP